MRQDEAPGREGFPYWRAISTRWMDQDAYGHVNNVEYYSYFDSAVNHHLIEEAGLNPRTTDVVGLVVDTQCSFFRELTFPESIDVGVRVARIGSSSITYEIGIFKQDDERPAAFGAFTHVYVIRESMTPTPIPDRVRRAVEHLHI